MADWNQIRHVVSHVGVIAVAIFHHKFASRLVWSMWQRTEMLRQVVNGASHPLQILADPEKSELHAKLYPPAGSGQPGTGPTSAEAVQYNANLVFTDVNYLIDLSGVYVLIATTIIACIADMNSVGFVFALITIFGMLVSRYVIEAQFPATYFGGLWHSGSRMMIAGIVACNMFPLVVTVVKICADTPRH